MIDLTHLVFFIKSSRNWLIIGLVSTIVFFIILNARQAIINALFPPKPAPETVAFGILPQYDLTDGVKPPDGTSYKLETITGGLPTMPKNAKVFGVAKTVPSFSAEQTMKDKAASLRFKREPLRIIGGVYEFPDEKDKSRTLYYDILTNNFSLGSNFSDPSIVVSRPIDLRRVQRESEEFFSTMGLNKTLFPENKVTTKPLKFTEGQLTEIDGLNNADVIEVDYNFVDFDEYESTYIRKGMSLVYSIVQNFVVVFAKKELPDVALYDFATYPLKPIDVAWEELQAGKGYFNSEPLSQTIEIKDVKLGYVISKKNKDYIQPVYFFNANEGFRAYIPAVSSTWTAQ